MTTEMSPVSMTDKLAEFLLPTKGFQFSSYAWWAIKRGMERCFSNSRAVRFPAYLLSQFRRLNQVIADLWQEDGEKPKVSLVAKALEMTEETDTEITAARDLTVYLLARKCLLSYEDIARILSFRSPSRCEMAMRRIREQMKKWGREDLWEENLFERLFKSEEENGHHDMLSTDIVSLKLADSSTSG